MENHCIEEPFMIRSYGKAELAHLYNPDMPIVAAMRKMRYWIRRNPALYKAMYQAGEAKGDHRYTRRQVRLIAEVLGEP
ncbi:MULTISPECIES: DUF4248 domain-containing protein [Bacteroides]|jgi:hypothetical protein|uniref:DUF4248 domain-containing protein n=1 Tax=Bacteroides TaxID=816 RepID=UPI000C75BF15|nr:MULTISPECIES: DUF4248 domain-containing protein [Bacteroides]RGM48302.1 DUF4248 domain-containing protein [Bacteroides sp. OM08-11]